MQQIYLIDENGVYIKPAIVEDELPTNAVTQPPPQGLYRARWTGTEWVEDMTQEEIDAIRNQIKPPTTEQRLQALEEAMIFLTLQGGM